MTFNDICSICQFVAMLWYIIFALFSSSNSCTIKIAQNKSHTSYQQYFKFRLNELLNFGKCTCIFDMSIFNAVAHCTKTERVLSTQQHLVNWLVSKRPKQNANRRRIQTNTREAAGRWRTKKEEWRHTYKKRECVSSEKDLRFEKWNTHTYKHVWEENISNDKNVCFPLKFAALIMSTNVCEWERSTNITVSMILTF